MIGKFLNTQRGKVKELEKNSLGKRLDIENVPSHLFRMEEIFDGAVQRMDTLEKKMDEYMAFQSEIEKLEAYYTSRQWKDDFAMDEAGQLPPELKRGILSEDGIYNLLERNKELLNRIKG